jgi:hypothetical protein
LLALLLAHWGAHAQIYMCKDGSGRTLTSDRPIPECSGRILREFDRNGIVRREILPPPTPEQKRDMQLQEDKRKQEQAAAEDLRKSDRAMRFRFHNEAEIEVARKRELDGIQEQIKRETGVLAAAEKRRQSVRAEMDSHRKRNEAVPGELERALMDAERAVREAKKMIAGQEAEISVVNARHDETVQRYRVVTGVAVAR